MALEWDDDKSKQMGRRITAAREARGFSLQNVADRLGVSKGSVGHWETGVRAIKHDDLARLCDLLKASADEILFGKRQWPFASIDLDKVLRLEPQEISQLEGGAEVGWRAAGRRDCRPASRREPIGGSKSSAGRAQPAGPKVGVTTARVYVFRPVAAFPRKRGVTTGAVVQCITGSWGLW